MVKGLLVALLAAGAVAYAAAQPNPVDASCRAGETWLDGQAGPATVRGFRIPPSGRAGAGMPPVTFCLDGTLVVAEEAILVERDGRRTFHLNGEVTLTLPARR